MIEPPIPAKPAGESAFISLARFLKRQGLAPTGGQAKALARTGGITVNGQAETRPGRKLRAGDVVVVGGRELRVALADPSP